MNKFEGFPARMEYTPLPNVFFSGLLPHIDDMAELKTTLSVLAKLYRKKGYPRYVSFRELLGDDSLMDSLRREDKKSELSLHKALEKAVAGRVPRGTEEMNLKALAAGYAAAERMQDDVAS